ncbi:hypothetical protein AXK56_11630 [Tsukamurella pulmonis]|nr:hypothetical protein AXK56_11630 [Tsukamurella pulmonis]
MTARWSGLQALTGDRQSPLDDLLHLWRQIAVLVRAPDRRLLGGAAEGLAQLGALVVLPLGVVVARHEVPIS